jgi:hypothetical protein
MIFQTVTCIYPGFCMYSLSGEEDLGWRGCHIVLKSLAAQLKPSLIAASVAFEFDLMEHN